MPTSQRLSVRLLLTVLVAIATVFFTTLWTSVQQYNGAKKQQQQSLSTLSSSSKLAATMFENLVKENFVQPSQSTRKQQTTTQNTNYNNNKNNSLIHSSPVIPYIWVIYFPQYHPDPLNDKNWGVNFTDWVSLQKSPTQNRLGFDIPRPLGGTYYDLRDEQPRQLQGELADRYGVDGFIYHHYWFYDRSHPGPNLAAPLLNMLKDGHPNIPFLLNWCGKYNPQQNQRKGKKIVFFWGVIPAICLITTVFRFV
jgi:hypothetical protein